MVFQWMGCLGALPKLRARNGIKDHNDEVVAGQVGCGHLKLTTAMVIGKEIDELRNVSHLNVTTLQMLLPMFRGIDAGWAFNILGDGLY